MADSLVSEIKPDAPAAVSQYGPSYNRKFVVEATSDDDARAILKAKLGITRGAPYQNHQGQQPDPAAVCLDIDSRPITQVPIEGTGYFEVQARYGYIDRGSLRAAIRPFETRRWLERGANHDACDTDIDGFAITNAADEPLRSPVYRLTITKVLCIEWYRYFQDWRAAEIFCSAYDGKVNSEPYYSAQPECLLCLGIDPEEAPVPSVNHFLKLYKLRAKFEYRPPKIFHQNGQAQTSTCPGWRPLIKNIGRRIRFTDGSTIQHLQIYSDSQGYNINERGALLTDEINLSLDGFQWNPANAPTYLTTHSLYEKTDFNGLGV